MRKLTNLTFRFNECLIGQLEICSDGMALTCFIKWPHTGPMQAQVLHWIIRYASLKDQNKLGLGLFLLLFTYCFLFFDSLLGKPFLLIFVQPSIMFLLLSIVVYLNCIIVSLPNVTKQLHCLGFGCVLIDQLHVNVSKDI